jgi:hypothetical protein
MRISAGTFSTFYVLFVFAGALWIASRLGFDVIAIATNAINAIAAGM